jgi:ribose-phosphate pyrophosphokinase
MSIQLWKNGRSCEVKQFLYPGGEVGVRVNTNDKAYWRDWPRTAVGHPALVADELDTSNTDRHTIIARIRSSDDLMALLLTVDAIRKADNRQRPIELVLPYFPYARQDRVCSPGDSFSLGVFATLIANLGLYRVTICDPHSGVTPAVLDAAIGLRGTRVKVYSQFDLINKNLEFCKRFLPKTETEGTGESVVVVAPDNGAEKKCAEVARFLGKPMITAGKTRNQATGEITGTFLHSTEGVKDATCLILDDICDGGRTFIELAKVLKEAGAKKVVLYVTHAVYSKGEAALQAIHPIRGPGGFLVETEIIDELWTTDTYKTEYGTKVNVFRIPFLKMLEEMEL